MTAAPTIDTDRLTLRAHTVADFADMVALWGDAEVTRHIGGRPQTPTEVWARLLRYAGLWPLLGYGYWAVRERESGRFVGEVGLADFRRAIDPPLDAPEAGWVFATHAQGRGYATEAVRAALAWGDAHLGGRAVCIIDPENLASMRVAAKCGFAEVARPRLGAGAVVLLERRAG